MVSLLEFSQSKELFAWAADNFITQAKAQFPHKKYFDVALAGGKTAQEYFFELKNHLKGLWFLKRLRFFVSDERIVDISSEESNAGNAWRSLLKPLGLSSRQLFSPYEPFSLPKDMASRYEKLIKELLSQVPIFDIIYLGIGEDGHIASLFPYSSLVKNHVTDERLVGETDEEKNGFQRISFMPRLIKQAASICVMAPGQKKASIIHNLLSGSLDPLKLPAQLILRDKKAQIILLQSKD